MVLIFAALDWPSQAARVVQALHLADISVEKAAVWMDVDPSQLRRQLAGDGHLSYRRLTQLPCEFWRWWALLVAEDVGLPFVVRRAARLHLALSGTRKKMARAVEDQSRSAEQERKQA